MTLPVAILLCEWLLFQEGRRSWLRRGVAFAVPALVAISVVALIFKGGRIEYLLTDGYARHRDFTLTERVMTQTRVVLHYLTLVVLPLPQRLILVYDFPLSRSLVAPWTTMASLVTIAAMIGGAVCGWLVVS